MRLTLERLQFLSRPEHDVLLQDAGHVNPQQPAEVERFRQRHHLDADYASAAIHIAQARHKAQVKLRSLAENLIADVEAVEQADSLNVARYKAGRFSQVHKESQTVYDLCSGMGVTTFALSEACGSSNVTAVDHDAGRAWMSQRFAGCNSLCADVSTLRLPNHAMFHIDPSRRSEGRRLYQLSDYQPGPDVWRTLLAQSHDAAHKLSPGVDIHAVEELLDNYRADALETTTELEFISESGRLVQSVLWFGSLAGQTSRRATRLDEKGDVTTLEGEPDAEEDLAIRSAAFQTVKKPIARYLVTVDPAVERAGLMSVLGEQLGATLLYPKLGLLICDDPPPSHPMIRTFLWQDVLPFRPRKIKRWLREHDAGHIEIKTRGGVTDPDPLQVAWSRPQGDPFTLFILRFDKRVAVLVTQRL